MPEPYDEELAAELRELSAWLETPEPADARAAVRARLRRPAPRRRRWRAGLAAVVAVLAGTVAAVAPARAAVVDAVGDLLQVAGIVLDRGPAPDALPATPGPLPSTGTVTLEEARRAARFPLRVPAALGDPERVMLADPDRSGAPRVVTLVYRSGAVRLDQFDGRLDPVFLKSAPATEWLDLGTGTAVWLPAPHPVTYLGRDGVPRTATARLAGPTLIWTDGERTYRLEGLPTSARAAEVARSLR